MEHSFVLLPSNCSVSGDQRVLLGPGETIMIETISETNPEITIPDRHSIELKVRTTENIEKQIYLHFNIIPFKQPANDLYHRIPINLSTRFLSKGKGDKQSTGYQIEISGSGSIDPEGEHLIDFIFRGPNQFDLSLLGLYDQYSFSYYNKFMELKLGDQSFSLTPLTEYTRFGRGIENKFMINDKLSTGVLFVIPRFYDKIKSELGLYANYQFYKENSAGIYFLQKFIPEQNTNSSLISLSSKLKPFEKTQIETEISLGKNGENTDFAYYFILNTQFSHFSLNANYNHAGKTYPGFYSNATFYTGSFNYQTTDWLSFGLSARQDFSNAELDTLYSTAPFSKNYQVFINLKLANHMFFKGYYKISERKDRFPVPKFHFENNSMNFNFSHKLNRITYRLTTAYGKSTNLLLPPDDQEKNTFNSSANISYSLNQKFNLQAFINYANMYSFISEEQKNWIFGLTASGSISTNLKAYLHFQNTYSIEESYRNRNLLQFNLDYQFLEKHRISLNSFYTIFQDETNDPDLTLSLNYSFNFGIPVKKIEEAGSVSGQIKNLGVNTTEGIILYLNGISRITDENGYFSFKNIKPGIYNMLIDQSTINMYDIPDIKVPIEVIVESNFETAVNFGLVKAAHLTGKLELTKSQNISSILDDDIEIGNLVLELYNNDESIRIISENDHTFSFPFMRPGNWNLKVFNTGLDNQLKLEKEIYELSFEPGENKEIAINVTQKKKNIIFMNNSINISSGDD